MPAKAGANVVVITSTDKLRKQLGNDLDVSNGHVWFSSQSADRCTMKENGIEDRKAFLGRPLIDMYSEELSLFVLDEDIEFFEQDDRHGAALSFARRTCSAQMCGGLGRVRISVSFKRTIDTELRRWTAGALQLADASRRSHKNNAQGSNMLSWVKKRPLSSLVTQQDQ